MLNCNNCGGDTWKHGLSAAPSWYDNIVNSASSAAENIWNDVESAGTWAGNEASSLWSDIQNPGAVPGNPISAGYQAGQDTRQAVGQDIQAAGSAVGSGLLATIQPLIIFGLAGLAAFILIEKE